MLFVQRETKSSFDMFIVQHFYLVTSWRLVYVLKLNEKNSIINYHMDVYSVIEDRMIAFS